MSSIDIFTGLASIISATLAAIFIIPGSRSRPYNAHILIPADSYLCPVFSSSKSNFWICPTSYSLISMAPLPICCLIDAISPSTMTEPLLITVTLVHSPSTVSRSCPVRRTVLFDASRNSLIFFFFETGQDLHWLIKQ